MENIFWIKENSLSIFFSFYDYWKHINIPFSIENISKPSTNSFELDSFKLDSFELDSFIVNSFVVIFDGNIFIKSSSLFFLISDFNDKVSTLFLSEFGSLLDISI